MDITVIPTEESVVENISLRSLRDKPKQKPIEYSVEKKELSKNIQKFDSKPRVYTENPFSHKAVSMRKKVELTPSMSANELISNPLYNTMGKFLGVDTIHDWNRYYDKVYAVTEWAKSKTNSNELPVIIKWITERVKKTPNMGSKEIDSLYLQARINANKV